MLTIGQSIKQHRKKAKLTQKELAEKTGYHINHIQDLEKDRHTPKITTVIDIADLLGVSIDELVGHEVKGNGKDNLAMHRQ